MRTLSALPPTFAPSPTMWRELAAPASPCPQIFNYIGGESESGGKGRERAHSPPQILYGSNGKRGERSCHTKKVYGRNVFICCHSCHTKNRVWQERSSLLPLLPYKFFLYGRNAYAYWALLPYKNVFDIQVATFASLLLPLQPYTFPYNLVWHESQPGSIEGDRFRTKKV